MPHNFDNYPDIDRSKFVRYNPFFQKIVFGESDLIPFWVADTDFTVMPELKKALIERADLGLFPYESKTPDLKQTLSEWYSKEYNINIHPKRLLFTPSVNTSVALIIECLTKVGDGIMIQPPVYQAFAGSIKSLNRELVVNPLTLGESQYEIDFDDFESKTSSPDTKLFVLCSPHNPVGRVWTGKELKRMAEICAKNDVILVTDEIHGDIVYPPNNYIGMLDLAKQFGNNVIMISSAGKTFGIPGLLDSFITTPNSEYMKSLKHRIESLHIDKGNPFVSIAWEVIYKHGHSWLAEMRSYIQGNIEYVDEFLKNECHDVSFFKPEGTYQIWLNFRKLGMNNEELTSFIVKEAGLAMNAGYTYGQGGDGFMRMNIASPRSMIERAMNQLKKAIDQRKE